MELGVLLVADGACAGVRRSVIVLLGVGGKPTVNVFLNAELVCGIETSKCQSVGTLVDVVYGDVAPVVFFVETCYQVVAAMLLSKCLGWFASNVHVVQEEIMGTRNIREYRQWAFGDVIGVLRRWGWAVLGRCDVVVGHLWRETLSCLEEVGDDVIVRD